MRTILFIFFFSCITVLQAQHSKDIEYIRTKYAEVKNCITKMEKNQNIMEEQCYYIDVLTANSNKKSCNIIGNVSKLYKFYYTNPYDYMDIEKNIHPLKFVTIYFSVNPGEVYSTESLYDNGKLIFHYIYSTSNTVKESRYYFKNDELIQYNKDKEIITKLDDQAKSDANYLLTEANNLLKAFENINLVHD